MEMKRMNWLLVVGCLALFLWPVERIFGTNPSLHLPAESKVQEGRNHEDAVAADSEESGEDYVYGQMDDDDSTDESSESQDTVVENSGGSSNSSGYKPEMHSRRWVYPKNALPPPPTYPTRLQKLARAANGAWNKSTQLANKGWEGVKEWTVKLREMLQNKLIEKAIHNTAKHIVRRMELDIKIPVDRSRRPALIQCIIERHSKMLLEYDRLYSEEKMPLAFQIYNNISDAVLNECFEPELQVAPIPTTENTDTTTPHSATQ